MSTRLMVLLRLMLTVACFQVIPEVLQAYQNTEDELRVTETSEVDPELLVQDQQTHLQRLPKKHWIARRKLAFYYGSLALLGLMHGALNKYLCDGKPNTHFYRAPLREWVTGLVGNLITLLWATRMVDPNTILADMSPSARNWLAAPLEVASIGIGQMLGEIMPLPRCPGWRSAKLNIWAPLFVSWYGKQLWQACHYNRM